MSGEHMQQEPYTKERSVFVFRLIAAFILYVRILCEDIQGNVNTKIGLIATASDKFTNTKAMELQILTSGMRPCAMM